MKLSDYVIQSISDQGVDHVFEMIGGAIAHLLDSTYDRDDMTCVSVHHEQAAAFAAEGYARVRGHLGVALATSGPGALNLLTGVGSCYFDSVPCLFLTGQVNTYEYKFGRPVRQLGFQETDIVSIAKPIVKYAVMVTDPSEIRYQLEKSIFLAKHGRPGPVLLDLPGNIQRAEIDPLTQASFFDSEEYRRYQAEIPPCKSEDITETIALLAKAKRPMILVGGGVRTASAAEAFRTFVDLTGVPVVHSLMGLDVLPADHPLSVGLIGSYGNRYSNIALANCDFLLILGSRLDTRQTGTKPDSFARKAVKVHVDIEAVELNHKVNAELTIHADLRIFLNRMIRGLQGKVLGDYSSWLQIIRQNESKYPSGDTDLEQGTINPNRFMELLSSHTTAGDLIVLDVGQHQMWASQSFRLKEGQRLLNAGGMGAMGFALPAAIGAAKAMPNNRVIVIAGDGGLQVNLQELHTIVSHKLKVIIIAMNNNNLGMVRQFQDMYFGGRRQSTVEGYSCPDLTQIALAFGMPAITITTMEEANERIQEVLHAEGNMFVEVKLAVDTTVSPKLVVNKPIEDMSPALSREELASVMLIEPWNERTGSDFDS